MNALPYQPEIAQRMTLGTEERIPVTAEFYQTENGYWLAWLGDGTAFVLPPDLAETEPADKVEGAGNVEELLAMINSGEYAAMLEFDGTDEEWEHLTACGCGDEHHHH
ncbi:hypothetical protein ACKLNO_08480 [Neisseriaceae bacterium B1]